ncbi:glycoside hydrolase family 43 protein [Pseudobutyrivibrio xylanivorans]|uniref:Beta-xylosidase n=1 Tax=Pseudobutyrivibrio xylanivorans DSM 14809 TaxID=1123012 RepID=A0A1M6BUH8_PSEXY|nr:glycoside hydrolase 43 family protein [Pseudobutyrivibrio xylanivorans]SHI52406.1 Beta-xylosidase [Pseudobutyrivibrio xylanivorans DSM 14809]
MKVINPVLKMDMPDVDVIKVNDVYYMVSTTMFFTPGAPILRSKDLKNWEIVSYIFEKIEDNDIYELKNGKNAYGACQWATSLAYHKGKFYAAFVCNDMKKTYIFHSDDIEKSYWKRFDIDGIYHDMSFLFFDDKIYLVYGNGDIHITELNDNLTGIRKDGLNKLLFSTPSSDDGIMLRCEGCRAYVKDGYIYLTFIEWPKEGFGNFRRRQICYRSKNLNESFERKVIFDDDMGYCNRGIAQGAFIEADDGKWFSMLFQDHGAVGRIPYLIPMKWENGWPVIGIEGKAPSAFDIDITEVATAPLVISDSFEHEDNCLPLQFQWNHNPIKEGWSFTDRPGYLRLRNMQMASSIMDARNTLTERTVTPKSVFTIEGDFSLMKDGDYAGLAAFMGKYGTIGLTKSDGEFYIVSIHKEKVEIKQNVSEIQGFNCNHFWIRIIFDFENDDKAYFYYSVDGKDFIEFGEPLDMEFTLDVFVGYRIGVFSYGTKNLGGVVDFRNLNFSE